MHAERTSSSSSVTRVGQFRAAAQQEAGEEENYKGLRIYALPGLHEFVAARAAEVLPRGARVLDVAAGSGALSQRLLDQGYAVTAVDLVGENFRLHGRVPFHEANLDEDFAARLLPAGSLDGIFAVEIIEHLENPRHFLRQCHRLLSPGGRLLLSTPNPDNPISRALFICYHHFQWFTEKDYRGQGHITAVPERVLRQLCEESGFDIHWLGSFGDPYAHMRWWKMKLLARHLETFSRGPSQRGEILTAVLTRRG